MWTATSQFAAYRNQKNSLLKVEGAGTRSGRRYDGLVLASTLVPRLKVFADLTSAISPLIGTCSCLTLFPTVVNPEMSVMIGSQIPAKLVAKVPPSRR